MLVYNLEISPVTQAIQLSKIQHQAATSTNKFIAIVSGAGSGKTRVITERIIDLIVNRGVSPTEILALTFTNKAAQEMKTRIRGRIPQMEHLPFIGTFHAYGLQIIKKYDPKKRNFSIIDEQDQKKILEEILRNSSLPMHLSPRKLAKKISYERNQCDPYANPYAGLDPWLREVCQAYGEEKKRIGVMDFDDILQDAFTLLRHNTQVLAQIRRHVKHIVVDEYQDTNAIQYEFIKLIVGDATTNDPSERSDGDEIQSVCIVGDEDQSIYSWRGASPANISRFIADFPNTKVYKLEQSYRSPSEVLDCANNLISHNRNRLAKKLWGTKHVENGLSLAEFRSEFDEADSLSQWLKLTEKSWDCGKNPEPPLTIGILYRSHHQSRVIEESLVRNGIHYTIVGGTNFYERTEIKDLLAYLILSVNPRNKVAFERALTSPKRGIGPSSLDIIYEHYAHSPTQNRNILESGTAVCATGLIKGTKATAVKNFVELVNTLTKMTPSKAITYLVEQTEYIQYLRRTKEDKEADDRIRNVEELISATAQFEEEHQDQKVNIHDFLESIALMQQLQDGNHKKEQCGAEVTLMTLHAAKGLEFDKVIITGVEEGILPMDKANASVEGIEEERRLLYVGITRTKDRVLLTRSKSRYIKGQKLHTAPSRFINELSCQSTKKLRLTRQSASAAGTILENWAQTGKLPKQEKKEKLEEKFPTPFSGGKREIGPNCFVQHPTFGVGMVKKLEQKRGREFAEVMFKGENKTIRTDFLTLL